jgi:hypothetical protein
MVRGMGVAVRVTTSTLALNSLRRSLCFHPEALLLVHDDEAEVLRRDLGAEERVGAYEHVHLPGGEVLEDAAPLGRPGEAREALHADGEVAEAVLEGPLVLLHQDGRRREHHGLLAASAALNAALTATSVLPNPTSPQTSRSVGCGLCMSALTAAMAASWSGVSW